MPELIYDLTLNPVYENPTPLIYSSNPPLAAGNAAVGVVGGMSFNLDMTFVKQSLTNLGIINIDAYNIKAQPTTILNIESYAGLSKLTGDDLDFQIARHNLVNESLSGIMPRQDVLACRAVARVGVVELTIFANAACVADPELASKSTFCAIAAFLNNKIGSGVTEAAIFGGCKLTIKVTKVGAKEIVDITFDWARETGNDLKREITFWLNFINSTEGMIWLSNEFSKI